MVCQFCNLFQERLELKDREYEELQTRFTNYKLKSKARFAQLKQSIAQVTSTDDETAKNGQKKLLTDMAEANIRLEQLEDEINNLKDQLAAKQTELSDHNIKIHSLEDELRTVFEHRATSEANVIPAEDIIRRDLERMHSQMIYKDKRIMELNDTILDKERQILDLQEMCREQGQLVQAKAEACQIVRRRFMEIDSRTSREVSTETDISLIGESTASISPNVSALKEKIDVRGRVSSSPGRAVVQFKPSNRHSPPPADPSEDKSSYTTETATFADDGEAADEPKSGTKECTPLEGKRKHRKKVTFDLPPQPSRQPVTVGNTSDGIAQAIIDLTFENDQLRRTIQEMEDLNDIDELHAHISELEDQIEQVKKDGKNQVLKARAAAQGRIHDLEEKILGIEEEYQEKISSLTASLETLRQAREWVVKENGRLLEEIESNKVNYNKLKEELEESNAEVKNLRDEMDSDRQLIIKMADDVEEAQLTASMLFDQKISILDDVERLKEAIIAQDDYINVLEADVVIYERHIGILRDSLGASKIESRALIKSKAFETKLKALEQERDQITKRNNGELSERLKNLRTS
ncbi:hypothetical protein AB6A40_002355 [Gnathostoma spinigerum]|uniref:Uncharacterized protein n=1 Tax=Gnathostoma spinigerum TaxID=75299 RepID=A0ABD6E8X5_9BILA